MRAALTIAFVAASLTACTNTDNPQLAMCQAVAKQLTSNSVSSWDSDSNQDSTRNVTVKVAFTTSSGQPGSINCNYPKQENGDIDTAPNKVVFNNQAVDTKTLISAGTKASKELLAGTYKNTVERTNELAGEAAVKGKELADKAKVVAKEGAKALQDLQNQ